MSFAYTSFRLYNQSFGHYSWAERKNLDANAVWGSDQLKAWFHFLFKSLMQKN